MPTPSVSFDVIHNLYIRFEKNYEQFYEDAARSVLFNCEYCAIEVFATMFP